MRAIASQDSNAKRPTVALVTGTLAEPSVRRVAEELAKRCGVDSSVIVLNIQVAALMTADWVQRKLELPRNAQPDRVILPGYVKGDLEPIAAKLGVPVELGPRDVRDLPQTFGQETARPRELNDYDIEILAEINYAAHLSMDDLLAQAQAYRDSGADVIDLGCDPQRDREPWRGIREAVRELRDRGMRVSVDSFHPEEVAIAAEAGAELVLSVTSANCVAARDWGIEVVLLPDEPEDLASLDRTIAQLEKHGVRYRIDPVITPIGFGFSQALWRYVEARRRYPQAAMMMGVGNLTEMTEVDSAGVNMLLIGFCQELAIGSVLTTQVINWSRSAVREIDIARRIMHYAVTQRTVPKHLDERLVMLRDARLHEINPALLEELSRSLRDKNIRIFTDPAAGTIHAMNKDVHASGDDPFVIFDQLGISDPSHAFYLGFEMAKALTAITLGKNYTQDQTLNWGALTREEQSHHERRKHGTRNGASKRRRNARGAD